MLKTSSPMLRRMASLTTILLVMFVMVISLQSAEAQTPPEFWGFDSEVVTNTNDSGPGSLREAIANIGRFFDEDGGIIDFWLSGCPCTITLTSGELVINKRRVLIRGLGANQLTISGNNASRVFFIGDDNVLGLDGLTVTGGNGTGSHANGTGGGIYNNQGSLRLFNSTVSNNSASGHGGGIYNGGGLTLTNSTVDSNSASFSGGGIFNHGSLSLTNSTVASNSASGSGGGICNPERRTVTVTDSTVSGNSAGNAELFSFSEGGGIFNNGTLTVTNSLVSGNSAASSERVVSNGGGIFNNGTLTVFSSTVSGNSTVGSGGGIYNFTLDFDQTTLTLINVTVTGNRADSGGSGEEHGGGIFTFGTETLNNTIVAGNFVDTFSSDVSGDWFDTANHNLFGTALGGIVNGVNGNKVGFAVGTVLDPNLADNGGPTRTHALISGSPAIDAGFANGASTDQRGVGFARTFDDPDTINAPGSDGTDIGAFERQNGFLQPVDNMPVLNEVKAGQTVPLKFSLGGFQGMAIIAPGYPATSVVGCNASQPTSTIEETSTTGNTVLTYDAATGRYQYNWKTRKEDSGKCQILTIQLIDGTVLMAKFRLK